VTTGSELSPVLTVLNVPSHAQQPFSSLVRFSREGAAHGVHFMKRKTRQNNTASPGEVGNDTT